MPGVGKLSHPYPAPFFFVVLFFSSGGRFSMVPFFRPSPYIAQVNRRMSKVMLDGIPPTQADHFFTDIDNGVENHKKTKRTVEEHIGFSYGVQIGIPQKPLPIKS